MLRIELRPPRAGWLDVLLAATKAEHRVAVSAVPIDPISSIVGALLVVLEQHRDSVATLNHELSFLAVGAMRLDDFEWRGPVRELGLAWWRAFRRLEASFDATQWPREVESLRAACEGTSRR